MILRDKYESVADFELRVHRYAMDGHYVGENRRGDSFFVANDFYDDRDIERTLIVSDCRDGVYMEVDHDDEAGVIRDLFADGQRELAESLADALGLGDIVHDLPTLITLMGVDA